jgi:hypothetical protein
MGQHVGCVRCLYGVSGVRRVWCWKG